MYAAAAKKPAPIIHLALDYSFGSTDCFISTDFDLVSDDLVEIGFYNICLTGSFFNFSRFAFIRSIFIFSSSFFYFKMACLSCSSLSLFSSKAFFYFCSSETKYTIYSYSKTSYFSNSGDGMALAIFKANDLFC